MRAKPTLERSINVPTIRAIFAGGGTGGHLFPAIAIAEELKKIEPDAEILFIGTKDKIEARVVPQKRYMFRPIWISGFHRRLRAGNLLFPLKVIVSFMQSYSIIKNFKPDVVVGTGGYVSGPVLRAAIVSKVPTLIQEQNSYPGVTTRMLAQKVNEVHLTFESSKKYLQRTDNVFMTGNPTRDDLGIARREEAFKYFGFDPSEEKKTLLVFGGSLGAHTINGAIEKNLAEILKKNIRLIWQTGTEDFEDGKNLCAKYSENAVWVNPFIDRMDYAYAASDLVVCRAGATTIAELTRLGKPAILVPYPFAAANHQVENAKSLAESGAATIIYDLEVSEKLYPVLNLLLDEKRLKEMSNQSKRLGKPDAAKEIALRVSQLARREQ
jgi:UDP-N-acetylglucosamine--N-acetylmuramyl-(pentapeptide) pyrophosphoryl-undecaprenol N-acetylglucosamine transferase